MTPEQLIMKYRKEFFNIYEYDPPTAELIEDIKYNAHNSAGHIRYLTNQLNALETQLARKKAELSEYEKSYETHMKALEILRSENK